MACLAVVLCALLIGCSSDDNKSADLQRQLDMRADISPEDLAEIEEELEEFRMAQMLRDQEEMMRQQAEQARRDVMAAAGLEGGLARSPQAAVYAMSEDDTIASHLPGGETVVSPSTAALYWDWHGNDKSVAEPELGAAYVKSLSGDGERGLHVTYVIDGTEYPVHFTRDDYNPAPGATHYRQDSGEDNEAYLWNMAGGFIPEDDDHTDGPTFRSYHDLHGWSFVEAGWEHRGLFASGLHTLSDNLPTGSATFEGYTVSEWWDADNPEFLGVGGHTFIESDLSLEVNLDDGTISGQMTEFRIPSWHTASGENVPLAGSSADIASTPIEEARFGAEWVASGPMDALPHETLHGFTGRIIGDFYGPAAEEAAGVLSGKRAAMGDAGEQFLVGGFSASQVAPDQ
jgi:hypothetical protein